MGRSVTIEDFYSRPPLDPIIQTSGTLDHSHGLDEGPDEEEAESRKGPLSCVACNT